MIRVKKLTLFGFFLINAFTSSVFATNQINISPIVQIISYTDIYGKYPQMIGWGSASIINNSGIIISNDHVVDDGKGALAGAFLICVTKEISKKPVCDYTASLIARDDKLDISILKIDDLDIHGNKVDYSKFKTIDIDFGYVPKSQDETIAIGYPWIGADTISETKGIVSGVSYFNGYKYIKTDALISGGNSGGALIHSGKLVGIPTFGIGFWSENSMGYALSISEAKDFIEENISKDPIKSGITKLIDFSSYRKTIENINNSLKLQDDVFDVLLPQDYQVTNYIKNVYLTIELKKQKDVGVSNLSIYLEKVPRITSDKEKFYYFETKGFYSRDWQRLIKKDINGIKYFYPIDKSDLSDGNSGWGNIYFAVENGYLITINVQAPFYNEKRNKEVKKEIENLLKSIKIKKDNFSKIATSFSTNVPKVEIKSLKNAIVNTGRYKLYLGNLYENFEIYLSELTEYNGKGKTVEEIYKVQLKDVDDSLKSMIKFRGLDGFIDCGSHNAGNYNNYHYYNYYGHLPLNYDEKGNPIVLENCYINIYFPLNKELNRHNYLSLKLTSLKNNKERNLGIAIEFLKRYLEVEGPSSEINIPNVLKNQIKLNFRDISNQTKDYKNFLKLLVRYNMIENSSYFEGDRPITWGEFLDMYVTNIYKFDLNVFGCSKKDYKCKFTNYKVGDKTLDKIFGEIGITDYSEYIDKSRIFDFDTVLNYKLALKDAWDGRVESFLALQNLIDEEKNISLKQKINDFNNSIYGGKKVLIGDFYSNYSTTYFTTKTPRFYPRINKLVYVYDKSKINFSFKANLYHIELSSLEKKYSCGKKPTYSEYLKCNANFENELKRLQEKHLDNKDLVGLQDEYYFIPLTKAEAIEKIFTQVDFGLFDEKLALKKNTTVDDGVGTK